MDQNWVKSIENWLKNYEKMFRSCWKLSKNLVKKIIKIRVKNLPKFVKNSKNWLKLWKCAGKCLKIDQNQEKKCWKSSKGVKRTKTDIKWRKLIKNHEKMLQMGENCAEL